ncbi:hypothetical protein R3P38DRAFT_3167480 [Favolaschia claudopus]|uniref:Uncharacterized protein n=1 Tax=Favolaschia claudopus TaxID=2862362 RepID=A0AAW0EBP6_9AGAR
MGWVTNISRPPTKIAANPASPRQSTLPGITIRSLIELYAAALDGMRDPLAVKHEPDFVAQSLSFEPDPTDGLGPQRLSARSGAHIVSCISGFGTLTYSPVLQLSALTHISTFHAAPPRIVPRRTPSAESSPSVSIFSNGSPCSSSSTPAPALPPSFVFIRYVSSHSRASPPRFRGHSPFICRRQMAYPEQDTRSTPSSCAGAGLGPGRCLLVEDMAAAFAEHVYPPPPIRLSLIQTRRPLTMWRLPLQTIISLFVKSIYSITPDPHRPSVYSSPPPPPPSIDVSASPSHTVYAELPPRLAAHLYVYVSSSSRPRPSERTTALVGRDDPVLVRLRKCGAARGRLRRGGVQGRAGGSSERGKEWPIPWSTHRVHLALEAIPPVLASVDVDAASLIHIPICIRIRRPLPAALVARDSAVRVRLAKLKVGCGEVEICSCCEHGQGGEREGEERMDGGADAHAGVDAVVVLVDTRAWVFGYPRIFQTRGGVLVETRDVR